MDVKLEQLIDSLIITCEMKGDILACRKTLCEYIYGKC
jgi:hypothetical protein